MKRSDTVTNILKSLHTVQGRLEEVVKGASNEYFHSMYADLPSVLRSVRKALTENDLVLVQTTAMPEPGHDRLLLETTLFHTSGEWIQGTIAMRLAKDDPQGYGSGITYARRYGLMALLGIAAVDEDDDGNKATGNQPRQFAKPPSGQPLKAVQKQQGRGVPLPDKGDGLDRFKPVPPKQEAKPFLQRGKGEYPVKEEELPSLKNPGELMMFLAKYEITPSEVMELKGIKKITDIGKDIKAEALSIFKLKLEKSLGVR